MLAPSPVHVQSAGIEDKQRVGVLHEHLKNVVQELAHTQRLLEAKTGEVKSEDHLKQLAEREIGACTPASRHIAAAGLK